MWLRFLVLSVLSKAEDWYQKLLNLYKFFCHLNYPLWVLVLALRRIKGKEHKERYREKLGYCECNRPKKDVIWINALGLGETLSLTLFLHELSKVFSDHTILLTSSTLQSKFALENIPLPKNIIHQFSPVDNYYVLESFLDYWKPKMALFSELDIWPLRTSKVKERKIPLLLINARMDEKKKASRKRLGKLFSEPLKEFDHIFLQDQSSKLHLMDFGVDEEKTTVNGPLKVAGTMFPDTRDIEKKLNILFKDKLLWAAASLHESEEKEILEAYKIAKQHLPNLVLIMIPRAIELSKNTMKRALCYSNCVVERSDYCDLPKKETEILVVNRIGELGLWYKMAFISFIGNSLNFREIKTGKNPFEALQANSIVIHGPKMIEPGYEEPASLGISDIVENRNDISSAVVKYSVANRRKQKINRGRDYIKSNKVITQTLIAYILDIYKKQS